MSSDWYFSDFLTEWGLERCTLCHGIFAKSEGCLTPMDDEQNNAWVCEACRMNLWEGA